MTTTDNPVRPLDGLVVVELGIAIAAPNCGRYLANFGAEVIKIESPTSPDIVRLLGAAWARPSMAEIGLAWFDTGPYVCEMNAGKQSVALDLKHPDGMAAALRLIAGADIFITNYSTPAVRTLGLGYEAARAVRDDLIYIALPGFGSDETAPYYEFLAWGPNQAPLVGMDNLTGYPDQEPAGIATIAPPDYCSSLHAAFAVLTALAHRDRTGEGCFIDLSQYEATVALLGPYLMGAARTGEVPERNGNRVAASAPEGVYPCRGADRWVAISVTDDEAWRSLAAVAGHPEWAADPRFAHVGGREQHHDEIDALIAAWTVDHDPDEIAAWLQESRVASYPALDCEGMLVDPQIRQRRWYKARPSTRMGRDLFGGNPIRLSETPGFVERAGPVLGESTVSALTNVAGYSQAEVDALIESKAAFGQYRPELVLPRPYEPYLDILFPGNENPTRGEETQR